jgi:membrane protease subunit HflK
MSRSRKVVVDTKGGNQMLYLPLDKLVERSRNDEVSVTAPRGGASGGETAEAAAAADPRTRTER